MDKKTALKYVDVYRDELYALSDKVWETASTAFREYESVEALTSFLEDKGFKVEKGVGGVETAFTAEFGSGKPVIGLLGEFDALGNIGEVPEEFRLHEPTGRPASQGCGHNLLGVGTIASALILKEYLQDNPGKGTVKYFGCPGEEGGSGKAFMAGAGVFDGLDIALTWHPDKENGVMSARYLANTQVKYIFKGKSAHAAGDPEHGRSALDALELMNVGVQFLREHVKSDARIHYAITDAGGASPNVVQANAKAIYLIRAPKNSEVADLRRRVDLIADGAATMTETTVEKEFMKGCSNVLVNRPLEDQLLKNMHELPIPMASAADMEYLTRLNKTNIPTEIKEDYLALLSGEEREKYIEARTNDVLYNHIEPHAFNLARPGSTDVGDVSWVCPTSQIAVATWCSNTPGHSWQVVAQGTGKVAKDRMIYAGQVIAATAIDAIEDPSIIEAAKKDFASRVGDGYVCPIPKGAKPKTLG